MKHKKLFTEDHAEHLKDLAGKPYRPCNGTEGAMFQDLFCRHCPNDNLDDNGQGGCEIILMSLCNGVTEKDYPKEWIYDFDGQPICTAWVPKYSLALEVIQDFNLSCVLEISPRDMS